MAVNEQPPKLASQFWPLFVKKRVIVVSVTQVLILILAIAGLYYSNASITTWLVALLILAINLVFILLILISSIQPTRDLLAAIVNVAGEKTVLTPPNPNSSEFEKTGFRDALQTIYALSAEKESKTADTEKTADSGKLSFITEALDVAKTGFVAFDKNRQIVFANKVAPVRIDTEGKKELELQFNGNDTLENWLNDCAEHSVHEDHIWKRIPDKLPNEEGRRFFDVYASYEKGSAAETILTLVDRTDSYIVDEENLDFISFAAHELRGPITVIRGYLDVLNDELAEVLVDDQPELFRRLIVSANRLSGYIDNILNTSRYDRRHLKMNLIEDTVSAIYDVIREDMELRAGAQNRLLTVNLQKSLPTVAADRASMAEVFGNLIDNAIKYSNEGGVINVTGKLNGNFVEVSVQDNGIGMPESVVRNLFQKFYRSHRSRETVAGTGIGLYISKAIVESNGGTIRVQSEDGKGSTFTVSLPVYSTVADKLKASDNSNEGLISEGTGWIKNHSMYRG